METYKDMKKGFYTIVLIFAFALTVSAQTENKTITISQETADKCAKAFDEVIAVRQVVIALQTEIEKRKELQKISDDLIAKKDEVIANQNKLIIEYEKRKGTTLSFLFGLIKFRKN